MSKRTRAQDDAAEVELAKVRDRIRKNFPNPRAPLTWRKDSETRLVSSCGRFAIEKHGEGKEARYTAKRQPHTIIAYNRLTAEAAKEDCNRHASPLIQEQTNAEREREAERYPDR